MAARAQSGAPLESGAPAAKPERSRRLKVASRPAAARRSISDVGTLLALGLFAACLALAALHAVLVENQASLDDLIERNLQNQERIDKLQAEIAYLDSPEGLLEQAEAAGLVPSAELVVFRPITAGRLAPPAEDPFRLASSGWVPEEPTDRPSAAASEFPGLRNPAG